MISNASSRACSHIVVSRVMCPPRRVWSFAPTVPMIERERTVTPRTTPSAWTTSYPSSVNVVLVISGPMSAAPPAPLARQDDDDAQDDRPRAEPGRDGPLLLQRGLEVSDLEHAALGRVREAADHQDHAADDEQNAGHQGQPHAGHRHEKGATPYGAAWRVSTADAGALVGAALGAALPEQPVGQPPPPDRADRRADYEDDGAGDGVRGAGDRGDAGQPERDEQKRRAEAHEIAARDGIGLVPDMLVGEGRGDAQPVPAVRAHDAARERQAHDDGHEPDAGEDDLVTHGPALLPARATQHLVHQGSERRNVCGAGLGRGRFPIRRLVVRGLGTGGEPAGAAERAVRLEPSAHAFLPDLGRAG